MRSRATGLDEAEVFAVGHLVLLHRKAAHFRGVAGKLVIPAKLALPLAQRGPSRRNLEDRVFGSDAAGGAILVDALLPRVLQVVDEVGERLHVHPSMFDSHMEQLRGKASNMCVERLSDSGHIAANLRLRWPVLRKIAG